MSAAQHVVRIAGLVPEGLAGLRALVPIGQHGTPLHRGRSVIPVQENVTQTLESDQDYSRT